MASENPDNQQDGQSKAYGESLDKIEISKSVAVAVVKSSHNQEKKQATISNDRELESNTDSNSTIPKLQQKSRVILAQFPIYEKIILFLLDYFESNNTKIYESEGKTEIPFQYLKYWINQKNVETEFTEKPHNDKDAIEKYINDAKTDERKEINNRKISESLKQQIYDYLNELLL